MSRVDTPKQRLAVVYDWGAESQWLVVDLNAATAAAATWAEADAKRKQIEACDATDTGAVWNPKSGGY